MDIVRTLKMVTPKPITQVAVFAEFDFFLALSGECKLQMWTHITHFLFLLPITLPPPLPPPPHSPYFPLSTPPHTPSSLIPSPPSPLPLRWRGIPDHSQWWSDCGATNERNKGSGFCSGLDPNENKDGSVSARLMWSGVERCCMGEREGREGESGWKELGWRGGRENVKVSGGRSE